MSTGNIEGKLVNANFWPACDNCLRFSACARQPQPPAYPHHWHWGREFTPFPDGDLILRSWVGTSAIGRPHTGCLSYQVHPSFVRPLLPAHRRYLTLEHEKALLESLLDRLERTTPWSTRKEQRYQQALQHYQELLQEQAALRMPPDTSSPEAVVVNG
jgi:hypothetical protein